MIRQAIRAKFAARGILGFTADALLSVAAYAYIAGTAIALGAAVVAGVVVAMPLLAWDALAERRRGDEATSCRNGEDQS